MKEKRNLKKKSSKGKTTKRKWTDYFFSMLRKKWTCSWIKKKKWTNETKFTWMKLRIMLKSSTVSFLNCWNQRINSTRLKYNIKKYWKNKLNDLATFVLNKWMKFKLIFQEYWKRYYIAGKIPSIYLKIVLIQIKIESFSIIID